MKKTKLTAVILAVALLAGCGKSDKNKEVKNEEIVVEANISDNTSVTDTLSAISELTIIDDIAKGDTATGNFSSYLDIAQYEYEQAFAKKDQEACNAALYKIGKILFEASISEQLWIDSDSIKQIETEIVDDIDIKGDLNLNDYKVTVTYTDKDKNTQTVYFYFKEEGEKLLTNLFYAKNGRWSIDNCNKVYKAFQRFCLSTGTFREVKVGSDGQTIKVLDMKVEQNRVDAYDYYVGNRNNPSLSSTRVRARTNYPRTNSKFSNHQRRNSNRRNHRGIQ